MRRFRAAVLMQVLLVYGLTAQEARGAVGVWERMSGPGPWLGFFGSMRADLGDFKYSGGIAKRDRDSEEETNWWIVLNASFAFTLDNNLDYPADFEGSKRAYWLAFEPMLERTVKSWERYQVFLGLGYGFNHFAGDFDHFWRGSINPEAGVRILRERRNFIQSIDVAFAPKWFPKAFRPEEFGAIPRREDGGEWLLGVLVRLNFWQ